MNLKQKPTQTGQAVSSVSASRDFRYKHYYLSRSPLVTDWDALRRFHCVASSAEFVVKLLKRGKQLLHHEQRAGHVEAALIRSALEPARTSNNRQRIGNRSEGATNAQHATHTHLCVTAPARSRYPYHSPWVLSTKCEKVYSATRTNCASYLALHECARAHTHTQGVDTSHWPNFGANLTSW